MSNTAERLLEEINGLVRNVNQAVSRLAGLPVTPDAAPVDPGREVTISLRVQGRIPAGVNGQVNAEVERALSALARNQGVTVVPGSVRVSG